MVVRMCYGNRVDFPDSGSGYTGNNFIADFKTQRKRGTLFLAKFVGTDIGDELGFAIHL